MSKLRDKIALITGGTNGLGFATAQRFLSEGADVIITGRRQSELDLAIKRLDGKALGVQGDVSKLADLDRLYATIKEQKGHLDIVFANAGVGSFAPLGEITEEHFDYIFNVNVKGAFFLVKHAIPVIPDGGAIILTASVAGANGGLGGSTVYGSTKAAPRSFGRTIAKELTPRGIRVNTISPGPIITPILDKGGLTPAQKDNFIEGAKTRISLGRTGTAAEVAAAALYLATDATYTTGAELFVDGGLVDL